MGSIMTRREFGLLASSAFLAACDSSSRPRAVVGDPNVASWRAEFPMLRESVNGRPLAYFDSAATTQRPYTVIQAITEFYSRQNANPSSSLHTLAHRAAEQYEEARRTVARFINARDPSEIVWTRGTTEAINLVAATWGLANLRGGRRDEVLLTVAEHYSNLLPWRRAADRAGAHVRFVDVDDEGRIQLDDLDRKLSKRTRLVACSHVSNVVGHISPVAEICARAHHAGALVLLDAAQSVPHIRVDVQALGCDFLAFSSHKMLGPMGVGVLWGRRELLEDMPPYQTGSNMAHDVSLESVHYEHAAFKFGAGTPNVSGPIGLAAAVAYLNAIGREAVYKHERALTAYALQELAGVPGLRLLGPKAAVDRVPVFSFVVDRRSPLDLVRELDVEGIAIRGGDLAALPLLERLGATAAARASCYLYTTLDEVDRLVAVLRRVSTASNRGNGGSS
jgi:cysteine desulfurase/selenocysteine lyase